MAAMERSVSGDDKSKTESNYAVGEFGKYRGRYLKISKRGLLDITNLGKLYDISRFDVLHMIIKDWKEEFCPKPSRMKMFSLQPVSGAAVNTYSGMTMVIYDNDHELLSEYCSVLYGTKSRVGKLFSRIIDWWFLNKAKLRTSETETPD